jgi:SAM-dependent methyltransferase
MTTRHLDLGCGSSPRNPYGQTESHGVDIALVGHNAGEFFRSANLSLAPIPHPDSSFDSISAFDFLEHVPRVLPTANGTATRFPFIELMNEISRVLKPGGRFYAVTPAFPHPTAFHDPTHVNIITFGTWEYFCGSNALARMYGFTGQFELLRNEWAIHPEAFSAEPLKSWQAKWKRWRRTLRGTNSHVLWEFVCNKQA